MAPRKKGGKSKNNSDAYSKEHSRIEFKIRTNAILPPAKKTAGRQQEIQLRRTQLYARRVWLIENFLTASECAAWLEYGERVGFENVYHAESYDIAHRDNGRVEFFDKAVANRIWERLQQLLPSEIHSGAAVGCYDKIRIYRYKVGQRFGKHIDESNTLSRDLQTGATILIYLNSGMCGGETMFYADHAGKRVATEFAPKTGALLFHGCVSIHFLDL